jgi:catechol 2,3-dioxygenase-like lactoylglutathione lyase family enzyme
MTTEVIGIDHIYLTVSSLERAEPFYDRLLKDVLGFRRNSFALGGNPHVQYFNRQFGIVLRPARAGAAAHDRGTPGLHHLCLRVNEPADVDRAAKELMGLGLSITAPRLYPEYAPDYYALFLEDPDGLRLEVTNFRAERRARMEDYASI